MPLLLDRWTFVKWFLIFLGVFMVVGILLAAYVQGVWTHDVTTYLCPIFGIDTWILLMIAAGIGNGSISPEILQMIISTTYPNFLNAYLLYTAMTNSCWYMWLGSLFNQLLCGNTWWLNVYTNYWAVSYWMNYQFLYRFAP